MSNENLPLRIVAEVFVTWPQPVDTPADIIARRFEEVISVNNARGYVLESWQFRNVASADMARMTATIVAVFVRNNPLEQTQ